MRLEYIIFISFALIMNLIGFISMYVDKKRAQKGQWRIKEATLFLIAFFGGGLGSWLGMYVFRHKTQHKIFVFGIPLCFFVSYAIFITAIVLMKIYLLN